MCGAKGCPLWVNSGHSRLSLDHLVGDLLEMRWHVEAQRLGGLEVDDKLILRWRLHRHIGWLLALEDAIDVAGRATELIEEVASIADQAIGPKRRL
jgi:hypothetical protein